MAGVLRAKVDGQWVDIVVPAAPGGMPVGGAIGQALTKKTATNYDAQWTVPGGRLVQGGVLGGTLPTSGAITRMTNDMPLPGGGTYWLVVYNVFVASNAVMNNMRLRMYGVVAPGYFDHLLPPQLTRGSFSFTGLAPAGATPAVYGVNGSSQTVDYYADPASHSFYAVGLL